MSIVIKSSHGGDFLINDILRHRIISFVGSGGKTTLMFAVAKKLSQLGKKVIITTSTKIYLPTDYNVVLLDKECLSLAASSLKDDPICVIGSPCPGTGLFEPQKLCFCEQFGLTPKDFLKVADFVLIEADGSKHMPLKFPGENEPVIPAESDMVIAVAGMWCVGHPISEVCHRYELACRFLSDEYECYIGPDHKVTKEDVLRIMNSVHGYRKNVGKRAFLKYIFYDRKDYINFQI